MIKLLILSIFIQSILMMNRPSFKISDRFQVVPDAIQHFSVGFKNHMASALWLRSLQGFDYCEKEISAGICAPKSWLYQNINLASTLDPIFEPGFYRLGALALTVIISDYAGASIIFDRGVSQYPNYWPLLYSAGYHSYFEEKNLIKASQLFDRAAKNGAPNWVAVLAGRLAADGGNINLAEQILRTMVEENQDEKLVKRLKEKIYSLRKQSD